MKQCAKSEKTKAKLHEEIRKKELKVTLINIER